MIDTWPIAGTSSTTRLPICANGGRTGVTPFFNTMASRPWIRQQRDTNERPTRDQRETQDMSNDATVVVSDAVRAFVQRDFGLFIGGAQQHAHSERRLDVFNPASGERLATVADADATDVDRAVSNARAACAPPIASAFCCVSPTCSKLTPKTSHNSKP
jgi:hypothetical protein